MSKEKLGTQPAFAKSAFSNEGAVDPPQEGISKRFYAACAAMQGIIASGWHNSKGISQLSFEIADELLKQENL